VEYVAPILFALGTWWFSTVLMMWRSKRAEPGCRSTMVVMTLLAVAGLVLIVVTRNWTGMAGAYLAFVGGLALWAWHEMSYFLGMVTGPRPAACPPGVSGARRFSLGVQASLWHELAVVATALVLAWITWDAANLFGTLTFGVLWIMRWSAKLNIFLGVRNLHEEFWPDHLRYLGSYVHTAPMNALFPVSMIGGGIALAWMIQQAINAAGPGLEQAGWMLVATLMALALLEHVLMFLRVPDEVLWRLATGHDRGEAGPDLAVKLTPNQGS
jgi:putative photosynthetic complex assembly protein 2